MVSLDYNYQSSVCFPFLFQFCNLSKVKMTIALITMKKAVGILVVVVKWRHHAKLMFYC